ncbi:toll-like receptor 3 [Lytechinus pictus]|uniref:toll-like receptor 3 n=1 Tax=Lytechinus pictus TaxID=7653 RepID=UPI0030B9BA5B
MSFFLSYLILSAVSVLDSEFIPSQIRSPRCRLSVTSDGLEADCSWLGLQSVPLELPGGVTKLNIEGNRIQNLNRSSFSHLPLLHKLNLHRNKLASINEGTFDSLPLLRELSLSQNSLAELPTTIFQKNQKLELVDFTLNLFCSVPILALRGATNLESVILIKNRINSVNFTGFKSQDVEVIDLSSNNITSVRKNQFSPFKNISTKSFRLNYNKLTSLPDGVFGQLHMTKDLVLSHNGLQNFSLYPFLGMESLINLSLSSNPLESVYPFNDTTPRADLPPLKHVILSGHHLFTLPSRAFVGMGSVTRLDLGKGKLKSIENDSFAGMLALEILDLSSNRLATLRREMFELITRLHTLILAKNKFGYLPTTAFQDLRSLKVLDFTNNRIAKIGTTWDIPSLLTLDLTSNLIFRINDGNFYGLSNLTELTISSNPINVIKNNAFSGVENLQTLTMQSLTTIGSGSGRPFRNLVQLISLDLSGSNMNPSTNFFKGLVFLKTLKLRKTLLTPLKLWDNFRNASVLDTLFGLEYLSLSSNTLNGLIPGSFQNLTSLTRLLLEKCGIFQLPVGLFENLVSLRYLYLTRNNIKVLSASHFFGLHSLGTLLLDNNAIKEIEVDLFKHTPKISYVYFPYNLISVVHEGTVLPTVMLDISNNPLSCVCEMQWFMSYVDNPTNNLILVNPNNTICSPSSIQRFIGKRLFSSRPDSSDCVPHIIILACAPAIVLGLLVVLVATYYYRWKINYKLFHLKLAVLGFNQFEDAREHQDFRRDLNVIFHDDDEEWVERVFRPGIDEALPDFQRIAYGDRDLAFGMFYMDAIIDLMENSYKVAFIVTNTAIFDHSFINKFHMAVDHMNEVGFEKLVLIFVEDIPDNHLPYLMRLFLSKNKPYFLWSDNMDWQALFWAKFAKLMKTNKQINDTLPT